MLAPFVDGSRHGPQKQAAGIRLLTGNGQTAITEVLKCGPMNK
ncbi:hypothetical protein BH10CYA1_BH10CYA1_06210 [soil metagenome]